MLILSKTGQGPMVAKAYRFDGERVRRMRRVIHFGVNCLPRLWSAHRSPLNDAA
jgi:hypothetical protein